MSKEIKRPRLSHGHIPGTQTYMENIFTDLPSRKFPASRVKYIEKQIRECRATLKWLTATKQYFEALRRKEKKK